MKTLKSLAALLLLIAIGLAILIQFKALRYPGVFFDPAPLSQTTSQPSLNANATGAYLKGPEENRFRAYVPSPSLTIQSVATGIELLIENIHPQATLHAPEDSVEEASDGLLRRIRFSQAATDLELRWQFPEKQRYRFGVVGDTGANRELSWVQKRFAESGADFILHLGDLYYYPDDLGAAHQRFNQSVVPVYTAIGNHDFRGPNGASHELYLRNVGPLNSRFQLLGQCFINIDTGAYSVPVSGGYRAKFLKQAITDITADKNPCIASIIFTHKPFVEGLPPKTIPKQKHSLSGWQGNWVFKKIKALGPSHILAGHIHKDFEYSIDGIKHYVVGSGMAHKDLSRKKPAARLLIGEIEAGKPAQFEWINNEMPINYHCSGKIRKKLGDGLAPAAVSHFEGETLKKYLETACSNPLP